MRSQGEPPHVVVAELKYRCKSAHACALGARPRPRGAAFAHSRTNLNLHTTILLTNTAHTDKEKRTALTTLRCSIVTTNKEFSHIDVLNLKLFCERTINLDLEEAHDLFSFVTE